MSNDLIEIYKYVPQLVDHLHLPVQSGSDKVLLDMKEIILLMITYLLFRSLKNKTKY